MNRKALAATAAGIGLLVLAVVLLARLPAPDERPEDAVVIEMTAYRYAFEPGTDQPINVTKGSLVVLRITSTDVTHGLGIAEYGINVEIPPGETVEVSFRADKAGDFTMFCTVFCGVGHPDHKGVLHVA